MSITVTTCEEGVTPAPFIATPSPFQGVDFAKILETLDDDVDVAHRVDRSECASHCSGTPFSLPAMGARNSVGSRPRDDITQDVLWLEDILGNSVIPAATRSGEEKLVDDSSSRGITSTLLTAMRRGANESMECHANGSIYTPLSAPQQSGLSSAADQQRVLMLASYFGNNGAGPESSTVEAEAASSVEPSEMATRQGTFPNTPLMGIPANTSNYGDMFSNVGVSNYINLPTIIPRSETASPQLASMFVDGNLSMNTSPRLLYGAPSSLQEGCPTPFARNSVGGTTIDELFEHHKQNASSFFGQNPLPPRTLIPETRGKLDWLAEGTTDAGPIGSLLNEISIDSMAVGPKTGDQLLPLSGATQTSPTTDYGMAGGVYPAVTKGNGAAAVGPPPPYSAAAGNAASFDSAQSAPPALSLAGAAAPPSFPLLISSSEMILLRNKNGVFLLKPSATTAHHPIRTNGYTASPPGYGELAQQGSHHRRGGGATSRRGLPPPYMPDYAWQGGEAVASTTGADQRDAPGSPPPYDAAVATSVNKFRDGFTGGSDNCSSVPTQYTRMGNSGRMAPGVGVDGIDMLGRFGEGAYNQGYSDKMNQNSNGYTRPQFMFNQQRGYADVPQAHAMPPPYPGISANGNSEMSGYQNGDSVL